MNPDQSAPYCLQYRPSKYQAHELFMKVEKSFKNCVGCGSILEVLIHKLGKKIYANRYLYSIV